MAGWPSEALSSAATRLASVSWPVAGQQQHHLVPALGGEAVVQRGLGGGPEGGALTLAAVTDHDHDVRRRPGPPRPAWRVRPGRRGRGTGDQVVEQLAPDPALRLGHRTAEQQQQRGDQGGPFEDALVGVRHARPSARSTSVHSGSAPTSTEATSRFPFFTVRPSARDDWAARRTPPASSSPASPVSPAVRRRPVRPAQPPSTSRHHRGHVLDPAAAQHQPGHPVVRERRHAPRAWLCAFHPAGWPSLSSLQRVSGLLQQPGVVDRHRRVRGQRAEQDHLVLVERPHAPVGGEQHADHPRAELERHAQDGDQAFLAARRRRCGSCGGSARRRSSRPSSTAWRSGPPARRDRRPWPAAARGTWPTPSRRSPASRCRPARSRAASCRRRRCRAVAWPGARWPRRTASRSRSPARSPAVSNSADSSASRLAPAPQQRPHLQRGELGLLQLGQRHRVGSAGPGGEDAALRTRPPMLLWPVIRGRPVRSCRYSHGDALRRGSDALTGASLVTRPLRSRALSPGHRRVLTLMASSRFSVRSSRRPREGYPGDERAVRAAQVGDHSATSSGSISRLIAAGASMICSTTSSLPMPWVSAWAPIWFSTSGVRT